MKAQPDPATHQLREVITDFCLSAPNAQLIFVVLPNKNEQFYGVCPDKYISFFFSYLIAAPFLTGI
jgi:hypothetical protein